MNLLRHVVLAAALLVAVPAFATDVSMANGSVNFSTPSNWLGIMQTDGDPEVRVFQVPDPSPTASNTLARVTVTVKQVGDIGGYQRYVDAAAAKARELPGYQSIRGVSDSRGPNDYVYTAQESGESIAYVEHYWYRDGHAIQLRCLRPASSQAGAQWQAAFDQGCNDVAARLGRL
ncbi:hypothetical protein [Dyella sp.]|jgi:hypothetical protein|uniref:hypothetical protein n=1 Tax=Dyella sp. TaxID=1869338 RepID=UPI002D7666FB|nr:hypothetical protein [Dyella sp.]HET6432044.1 hypothetical protein [Dyella sp.]